MFDLNGKRALVTGASGGIGGAIARSLYLQGAVVVLAGTRMEALEGLSDKLGGNTHILLADLSSEEGPQNLFEGAIEAVGGIDILVNNAGVTRDNLSIRMNDDEWQTVLDVNLTAGFKIARACLRGMIKSRWGRIIGITSVVGATGNAGQANYAASKAGLTGMTKALATEVASRNITVNCVSPGFITTPMTSALDDAQKEALLNAIPAGRLGDSEDVAACVSFLASVEAAYVTGQTIHVNGGMAMI